MNLAKSREFLKPEQVKDRIHIIGCGAIGSNLADFIARFGITKISLYDFDTVEDKNVANQMFTTADIGKLKVDAVAEQIIKINPEAKNELKIFPEGYTGQQLNGYVFLAVDSIELRKKIASDNRMNPYIKGFFDFRMGLTDAQHYAADWKDRDMVKAFLSTMNFTDEEAKAAQPISACNEMLSVCPTVRSIVAAGVANFVNFVKGLPIKKMIVLDAFIFDMNAF